MPSLFNDFKQETVVCSDGQTRPMSVIRLGFANVYYTAYAILAYCDQLEQRQDLVRDRRILEAFTSVTVQKKSGKPTADYVLSLKELAKKVMILYDDYYQYGFVDTTLLANHRPGKGVYCSMWAPMTNKSGKPILGQTSEGKTTLSRAGLTELARAFRFYLSETVSRMFPRGLEESEWDSASAVYTVTTSRGRSTQSSADFADFAGTLLEVYDVVCLLSENCAEYQVLEDAAFAAGDEERAARQPQRYAQPRLGTLPRDQSQTQAPRTTRKVVIKKTTTVVPSDRFATLTADAESHNTTTE